MKCRLAIAFTATILITACGGGGSSITAEVPGNNLVITAGNAEAASKASFDAASDSGELADLGVGIGLSVAGPNGLSKPGGTTQTAGFLVSVMQKIPFGPDEFPCAVAGSIVISGNIADPLTLTPGDTFVVESTECDDGLGEVVDGLLQFTVTAFSGDALTGSYLVAMDAVVDNLQIATDEDTITSDGDVSVSLDNRSAPFISASVSGTSMTTDSNASSETLTNYSSDQTLDTGVPAQPYTLLSAGTLQTTGLSGTVRYSTPMRFEGFGASFPHSGELLVTGKSSSARLIALDDINIRIEIDSDGDGTVDDTINTTWAEFAG